MTSRTSRELPSSPVSEAGDYTNLSASGLVRTGPAKLLGIFVASASSAPTIKVWDQTSAAVPVVVNTFVPSAGVFYPMPCKLQTGLYVTISGTVDCTVFWDPRQI